MKQRDDNKVQQIFEATLHLVVKSGVAGITMRQIAKEAKMATGTLYIYFKDKEKLLNQLYISCRESSLSAYFKNYNDSLPFKEGFKIIWTNCLNHRLENFDESVFMEQCYHSPYISASTKEMTQHLIQPLYKLIEKGKEQKLLKDQETVFLLMHMMSSITGVIKYINYQKKKVSEEVIKNAFSICWDGLKR
ncbi:MAG: TetR/AcrR family transcriptional regulator [Chitinophagaceae bacterium]